ncbi:hypothetical protein KI387_001156 [Taxus chinensis]|uniref:Glycosyltransferase n=1 Tax=Taxus chinensis TaxID=29808 RepID=A0AA38GU96_TAXCH|nr:hypothetical protein KI387_001156 [Taxus chinensis]
MRRINLREDSYSNSPHEGGYAGARPHALVIPYPGQSHITPMMQLSKQLAVRGFEITFVNSGHNHKQLLDSQSAAAVPLPHQLGLDIWLVGLPDDDLPSEYFNNYEHVNEVYSNANGYLFREKVVKVLEDNPTVTCIISHHYLSWGQEVADKFGIPNVVYWSVMATLYCLYMQFPLLLEKGYLPLKCKKETLSGIRVPLVPDLEGLVPRFSLTDLPDFFQIEDISDPHYEFINRQRESLRQAKWVLVNTFESLETEAMEALRARIPVYSVGPLLPSSLVGGHRFESLPDNRACSALWPEENQCLQWLDTQAPDSVIYISFGSFASLTDVQIQELAKGIEASQQPFLWAVRPNAIKSGTISKIEGIESFVTRTKGRGMLVSWVPQPLVLQHPSVGGFLSHCGWNSTMEGISMGVPVLGCPLIAEQNTNAWFVEHHWKAGLSIKEGKIEANEVEKKIRSLMEEEGGGEVRRKCSEWKDKAREALIQGGSSSTNLDAFVLEMHEVAAKRKPMRDQTRP